MYSFLLQAASCLLFLVFSIDRWRQGAVKSFSERSSSKSNEPRCHPFKIVERAVRPLSEWGLTKCTVDSVLLFADVPIQHRTV